MKAIIKTALFSISLAILQAFITELLHIDGMTFLAGELVGMLMIMSFFLTI